MRQGVKLLLIDVQKDAVHYSGRIFARDGIRYSPVNESLATVISCEESGEFLLKLGIRGEVIHTPSHSADSISLILDDGDCIVGDLEPYEYIEAYEDAVSLKRDWDHIFAMEPSRVLYAHRPERTL